MAVNWWDFEVTRLYWAIIMCRWVTSSRNIHTTRQLPYCIESEELYSKHPCPYCSEQIIQENWIIKTLYHFQGQIYWACLDVCGWKQRLIVFFTVILHFCMLLSVFPVSYWMLKGFCQIKKNSREDLCPDSVIVHSYNLYCHAVNIAIYKLIHRFSVWLCTGKKGIGFGVCIHPL